jgi:hypothetical protein
MYAKVVEEEGDLNVISFLKIEANILCTIRNHDPVRTFLGFLGSVPYFHAWFVCRMCTVPS